MNKLLKCFISAPADKNTQSLRMVLESIGVVSFDAFDFQVGDSIGATIKSKIKEADFAVVVISDQNSNVYYELGICEGLGKPIFVIVEDSYSSPIFVHNYIYLRTSLENSDLLNMSLVKFISQLKKNKSVLRGRKNQPKKISHSRHINMFMNSIDSIRSEGSEIELQSLVQGIFHEFNISAEAVSESTKDIGVDFAIWTDKLGTTLGSFVLVEIKFGRLSEKIIKLAEQKLQGFLVNSEAKAGILLYLDKDGKRFKESYSLSPLIIRYDLEDFVKQIEVSSFEDAILIKRNKMVHGVR